jgi:hypothetical protein
MKQSKQSGGTIGDKGLYVGIPTPKLEGVPEAFRPFFEVGMKMQSELFELCGHRCNAWLDWPEQYCTCKTMEDLTTAQSEYLTRMQRDYSQFLDCILRDTLIEQDEFEEEAEDKAQDKQSQPKTEVPHREAA